MRASHSEATKKNYLKGRDDYLDGSSSNSKIPPPDASISPHQASTARDNLSATIERCVRRASEEGIRDTKPNSKRPGPAIGLTKTGLLEDVYQSIYNFHCQDKKLTPKTFGRLVDKLSNHQWPSFEEDISELQRAFNCYQIELGKSPHPTATRNFNRSETIRRFEELLSNQGTSPRDLHDAKCFIDLVRRAVTELHLAGLSKQAMDNSQIIKISIKGLLKSDVKLADYLSYITLHESYAAFRVEDIDALRACMRDATSSTRDSPHHKLPTICLNLIKHQQQLVLRGKYFLTAADDSFACMAYDALNSELKDGILHLLPYEPGFNGNAALDYQLRGSEMTFKPSRFGKRTLEEVLQEDIEASLISGQSEGAARQLFGLARGFLSGEHPNHDRAEKYIDEGFGVLASAISYHPTARAKGLVLQARLLRLTSNGRAKGRIEDCITQAKLLYLASGSVTRLDALKSSSEVRPSSDAHY